MDDDAYLRLRGYADDLAARRVALDAWSKRNPNADDLDDDEYAELVARDPRPRTNDLISVDLFLDVLNVALVAYERSARG